MDVYVRSGGYPPSKFPEVRCFDRFWQILLFFAAQGWPDRPARCLHISQVIGGDAAGEVVAVGEGSKVCAPQPSVALACPSFATCADRSNQNAVGNIWWRVPPHSSSAATRFLH